MRFVEIVESGYIERLKGDLVSLLISLQAEGFNEIHIKQLVRDLRNMGYSVDDNSLFSVLEKLPIVASVNSNSVTLSAQEGESEDGDINKLSQQAKKRRVDSMAKNQAEKGFDK